MSSAVTAIAHEVEPDRHKLVALEGLRGVAVLAVMAHHFATFLPQVGVLARVRAAMDLGWVGVDIFFALSGFLITGVLLASRGATNYYSSFFARRFLRIFPIYYLTLIVVFAAASHLTVGLDRIP